MAEPAEDRLMTPREVADLFRVNSKTVARWADAGLLDAVQPNPKGWRRYRESQVRKLLGAVDNSKFTGNN